MKHFVLFFRELGNKRHCTAVTFPSIAAAKKHGFDWSTLIAIGRVTEIKTYRRPKVKP